jgi:hypothetical protein
VFLDKHCRVVILEKGGAAATGRLHADYTLDCRRSCRHNLRTGSDTTGHTGHTFFAISLLLHW